MVSVRVGFSLRSSPGLITPYSADKQQPIRVPKKYSLRRDLAQSKQRASEREGERVNVNPRLTKVVALSLHFLCIRVRVCFALHVSLCCFLQHRMMFLFLVFAFQHVYRAFASHSLFDTLPNIFGFYSVPPCHSLSLAFSLFREIFWQTLRVFSWTYYLIRWLYISYTTD